MALDTTNVKHTLVSRYMEGIRMPSGAWWNLFNVSTDDVPAKRMAAYQGVGQVPAWDGTSDVTTTGIDNAGVKTMAYADYAVQVRVKKRDAQDIPELLGNAAAKLGVAVAATYGALAADVVEGSFTTTQTGAAVPLSLCNTSHVTAGGTRSNLVTSALDRTAFAAVIAAARKWVSFQDLPYDLVEGGWHLVISPDLEEAAKEMLGSAYSGSDMQVNVAGSYNTSLIVWSELAGNDWFLVSKIQSPFHLWERSAPVPVFNIDQDNLYHKITVDFALDIDVDSQPDGVFGSDVT